MPRRRRPKTVPPAPPDPVSQFGTMLRESAEREQAERDRRERARQAARDAKQAAAAHAIALEQARRELERAIAAARAARRAGSGVADADRAWRDAKARVIELETGAPPEWAPRGDGPGDGPGDGDGDGGDGPGEGVDEHRPRPDDADQRPT